ncbi:MAG: nucleoside monophosphate kinase [Alphaproteobacteria bacterium]|nr:nucleoside monophosphate kinase [Alphaproteobacteria bacterium]
MEKVLLLLFGAPGSGKGFLGDCLKSEIEKKGFTVKYVSTGDLLREEIAQKTPLGEQLAQTISSGQLVPDEVVDALVKKALKTDECVVFLDGYPRTYSQFEKLQEVVESFKVVAIKRDTPVGLILERVSKRRVCSVCKATHSVDDGCCPKCGGDSLVRKDDAVIEKRLDEYEANTAGLWNDLRLISDEMYIVEGSEEASVAAKEIVEDLF